MSFGKGQSPYKEIVDDAVRYAEKKDVLIVHAAGNASQNIDIEDNFPDDHYKKPKGFLFFKKKKPKNYLSIGASGPSADQSMVAEFSNYGPEDVDVFAPGVMMLSTIPGNNYEVLQGAKQVKELFMKSTKKDSRMVLKPGTEDKMVPFSSLSVAGGIIDVKAVLMAASQK